MSYRVDELAAAAGVSVELVRSYQTKGLLDPPRRDGRVALYDDRHLERLRTIRDLKDKGYSLKAIAGLLSRQHSDTQRSVPPLPPVADDEHLAPQELADRTRVPLAVLRSLEASGVIRARQGSGGAYYTGADVRAVRMLLSLLGVGLPMEEFMQLARHADRHDAGRGRRRRPALLQVRGRAPPGRRASTPARRKSGPKPPSASWSRPPPPSSPTASSGCSATPGPPKRRDPGLRPTLIWKRHCSDWINRSIGISNNESGPDGGMADTMDSKSIVRKGVRVQVPPRAHQ